MTTTSSLDHPTSHQHLDRRLPDRNQVAASKKWLALAMAVVAACAAAGGFLGSRAPVQYTAETRVAVGGTSLRALSVPGYVEATEQLASSYARYVNTSASQLNALAAELGVEARGLISAVSSPIPESNVVRVEVVATTPEAARSAADALSTRITAASDQPVDEDVSAARAQLQESSQREAQSQLALSDAQANLTAVVTRWQQRNPGPTAAGVAPHGSAVAAAKATLGEATTKHTIDAVDLETATSAFRTVSSTNPDLTKVEVIQPAAVTGDSSSRSLQWGLLGGLSVGVLLGAVILFPRLRRRTHVLD